MKKFLFYFLFAAVLFSACDDDDDPTPEAPSYVVKSADAFIINYGSYSSTVGSISGFDVDASKMYNYVYENVNGPMTGKPQYAYQYNDKVYFMGNNLDEIFYVTDSTLIQSKNGVSKDILKPRYCIGDGDYLYISCYGGDVWDDATLGYIAKYNIKTNEVEKNN